MTSPRTETSALLNARHLSAGYGDLRVLEDVSLEVRPNAITLILGRNGAGKTTLLRTLAGLNAARTGRITLQGEDLTHQPAHARVRRGLALVQEGKRLFHQRTVEENLMLGGLTLQLPRRELRFRCDEVYTWFPALVEKRRDRCGSLSGGQQQMVAIGQAIIRRPALLMLDEPSAGLAPIVYAQVLSTLTGLREHGVAVLLVEQAAERALPYANHIYVLDLGRVVLDRSADQVPDLAAIRDIYLAGRSSTITHSNTDAQ